MSASWLRDAVFYEIYPQSFRDSNGDGIGDLPGIAEKLPYVKSLGCNALWINPCFDSPFKDAGYDVRDYKKIAPRYGTNEDMAQLCRRAHALGIRVLLDLVPGHTSEEHEWFRKSGEAEPNEYSGHLDGSCLCRGRRYALHRRRIPSQRHLYHQLLQMSARPELRLPGTPGTLAAEHHQS